MFIDFMLKTFADHAEGDCIIWRGQTYSYGWLLDTYQAWTRQLSQSIIVPNSVVALEGDFSPNAISVFLALVELRCIIVPLSPANRAKKNEFYDTAEIERVITVTEDDEISFEDTNRTASHELISGLREADHPGMILFSSGSTGKSKAAVHDLSALLEKFAIPRHSWRTVAFLLFDHIGGINTLFYTLSNAGCLITVRERSPDSVCSAIDRHRAQLLPTSPTFLNLLLLSEAYRRFDLSSLEMVTYGTEIMPETTLKKIKSLLPNTRLLQTYGLSEVGILRSKSKSSESLWFKVGGEGFQTRIVDGVLHIKAKSAMLGYLNAPSPFTPDGWLDTGDAVEVDGEYIRIFGREAEIINVGGEKVHPAEVEEILQTIPGVQEVIVNGIPSPITGQMVQARVKINTGESLKDFRVRMRAFCEGKLAPFKIPQKVVLVDKPLHGERFKKIRRG